MEDIDITGIDHAELLVELHRNACSPGMGMLHRQREPISLEAARELLKTQKSFDYLIGRVMKVSLDGNSLKRAWLYDRDNGDGAAQGCVDAVRDRATKTA